MQQLKHCSESRDKMYYEAIIKEIELELLNQKRNAERAKLLVWNAANTEEREEIEYRMEQFNESCSDLIMYANDHAYAVKKLVASLDAVLNRSEDK